MNCLMNTILEEVINVAKDGKIEAEQVFKEKET